MTDVEILKQYRYTLHEVAMVARQLKRLRALGANTTQTEQRLAERQGQLNAMVCRCEEVLSRVRDRRTAAILRSYYAVGLTDEQIGEDIGLSGRMTNVLRNRWIKQSRQAG